MQRARAVLVFGSRSEQLRVSWLPFVSLVRFWVAARSSNVIRVTKDEGRKPWHSLNNGLVRFRSLTNIEHVLDLGSEQVPYCILGVIYVIVLGHPNLS